MASLSSSLTTGRPGSTYGWDQGREGRVGEEKPAVGAAKEHTRKEDNTASRILFRGPTTLDRIQKENNKRLKKSSPRASDPSE
jgi:hypothetical protein